MHRNAANTNVSSYASSSCQLPFPTPSTSCDSIPPLFTDTGDFTPRISRGNFIVLQKLFILNISRNVTDRAIATLQRVEHTLNIHLYDMLRYRGTSGTS